MTTDDYEITCARCMVTFTGRNRDDVMVAFRGHEKEAHGFMTGQQFYERFEKEFLNAEFSTGGLGYMDAEEVKEKVLEAASRAAGLTDE